LGPQKIQNCLKNWGSVYFKTESLTIENYSPMPIVKKPAVLFAIILASFLFVFATKKAPSENKRVVISAEKRVTTENNAALFSELHLSEAGMNQTVFISALHGLEKLDSTGAIARDSIITIIDFSQPSDKKRLYVLNLASRQVLFNTLVAHGRNSGKLWTKSFSNSLSSLKSSPGFYVTRETYTGDNGYSLRLDGLEKNINDNARARSIVMHGAPYVDQSSINALGFLGRSWGCPAIPLSLHTAIINTIKDGTCLFIYSPDKNYQRRSTLLGS
jgi:L,D-transpeptidase-like protein